VTRGPLSRDFGRKSGYSLVPSVCVKVNTGEFKPLGLPVVLQKLEFWWTWQKITIAVVLQGGECIVTRLF
jgi:hypothetical protein